VKRVGHSTLLIEQTPSFLLFVVCTNPIYHNQALAYSASRDASKITHLNAIFTCTFALMFFGTPHNGSSKARLLGTLQKLASAALPKATVQFESSLLNALDKDSETLQNITDQFAPLLCNFRIFFLWEQEKTDMKYTKDYIVDETSAAPILDNTERSGIAADHRGMVKFNKNTEQGFRITIAALKRYFQLAPQVIQGRLVQSAEILSDRRRFEAMEILKGSPLTLNQSLDFATLPKMERASTSTKMLEESYHAERSRGADIEGDNLILPPTSMLRSV
jgi:hypothetical protein